MYSNLVTSTMQPSNAAFGAWGPQRRGRLLLELPLWLICQDIIWWSTLWC